LYLGDVYPTSINSMFKVQMSLIPNQKVTKKVSYHWNQIIHILFLLMMELNINMHVHWSFAVNSKELFEMNSFPWQLRLIIIKKKVNRSIIYDKENWFDLERMPVVIVVIEGCADAVKKGLFLYLLVPSICFVCFSSWKRC
jgi:hypothetical protein